MTCTNYTLDFKEIPGFSLQVRIGKSFDEKTGFTTGYPGDLPGEVHQVFTVRALSKSGVRPTKPEEISTLLPWNVPKFVEFIDASGGKVLVPAYPETYKDEHNEKGVFTPLGLQEMATLTPAMFSGHHYFLELRSKKGVAIPASHLQYYTMLFNGLAANIIKDDEGTEHEIPARCVVVKYVAEGGDKYGIIYTDENSQCLRFSQLIAYNFQRERKTVMPLSTGEYSDIIAGLGLVSTIDSHYKTPDYNEMNDECEAAIKTDIKVAAAKIADGVPHHTLEISRKPATTFTKKQIDPDPRHNSFATLGLQSLKLASKQRAAAAAVAEVRADGGAGSDNSGRSIVADDDSVSTY